MHCACMCSQSQQAESPLAVTSSWLEICSSESQQATRGTGILHLYSNTTSGMQIQKIYMSWWKSQRGAGQQRTGKYLVTRLSRKIILPRRFKDPILFIFPFWQQSRCLRGIISILRSFIDIQYNANLALCLQAVFISTKFTLNSPPGQPAFWEECFELTNLSGPHIPFHDPLDYPAQLNWSRTVFEPPLLWVPYNSLRRYHKSEAWQWCRQNTGIRLRQSAVYYPWL